MDNKFPLHISHVEQTHETINKITFLVFSASLLSLLYYRFSVLFQPSTKSLPWLLITISELLLSVMWIYHQAYRWRPVSRSVFPERLPGDDDLPPIDVFVLTCDPEKEPTVAVMNTVVSAMCLDYPPEKLSIYISNDGGAPITLYATREAYKFAKRWIPFCKKYGIRTRAPETFFSKSYHEVEVPDTSIDFVQSLKEIESRYKKFKHLVEEAIKTDKTCISSNNDHSTLIEVILDNEASELDMNNAKMPLLVYVSREKRPSHHSHFKAGAINVLLRVSGVISNAPYVLSLDCDMCCNDAMSARQAMCFHLDPQISQSLAFVQFPQNFHNLSKNDIYNVQMRSVFKIWWHGMDGLMGPMLSGTCFYLKREALYKNSPQEDIDHFKARKMFGPCDEFLASISGMPRRIFLENEVASNNLLEEAKLVASCTYEQHTVWGEEIGFRYHCVVEDFFTGMMLHCKGWISVYYDHSRPTFLGTGTTNLNDTLIQGTRWGSGPLEIGFSRFIPVSYRPSKMCIFQIMAYLIMFQPLNCYTIFCHSLIPQLCLLSGVRLYPKASDPWLAVFAIFFISPCLQLLYEVLSSGGSFKLYWNEQRLVFMKGATANLLACLNVLKKSIGMKEIDFSPTNKSSKESEIKKYQADIYDFDIDAKFQLILTTIASLNIASLTVGMRRAIIQKTCDEFGQIFLAFIILLLNYPVIEAMIIRTDSGRIPTVVTLISLSVVLVCYQIGALMQ